VWETCPVLEEGKKVPLYGPTASSSPGTDASLSPGCRCFDLHFSSLTSPSTCGDSPFEVGKCFCAALNVSPFLYADGIPMSCVMLVSTSFASLARRFTFVALFFFREGRLFLRYGGWRGLTISAGKCHVTFFAEIAFLTGN